MKSIMYILVAIPLMVALLFSYHFSERNEGFEDDHGIDADRVYMYQLARSLVFYDAAIEEVQSISYSELRKAISAANQAYPRKLSKAAIERVVVVERNGVVSRQKARGAKVDEIKKDEGKEIAIYYEDEFLYDFIGSKIQIRGDLEKAVLLSPGANCEFGDADDKRVEINFTDNYFVLDGVVVDYDSIVESMD